MTKRRKQNNNRELALATLKSIGIQNGIEDLSIELDEDSKAVRIAADSDGQFVTVLCEDTGDLQSAKVQKPMTKGCFTFTAPVCSKVDSQFLFLTNNNPLEALALSQMGYRALSLQGPLFNPDKFDLPKSYTLGNEENLVLSFGESGGVRSILKAWIEKYPSAKLAIPKYNGTNTWIGLMQSYPDADAARKFLESEVIE